MHNPPILLYFLAKTWRIVPMLDIFTHAMFAGFLVATPPGVTQLVAFERTLNRSLGAGWMVAFGATIAHMIFALAAVLGINAASGWGPMVQATEFLHTHKAWLLASVGVMMLCAGIFYYHKKPSQPKLAAEAGILIGITIPLMDIGNFATHAAAISLGGQSSFTVWQIPVVVLAVTLGAHLSWAWKLGFVHLGKRQLQKRNVQNFNRVFGWMLISMATLVFIILAVWQLG